MQNKKTKKIIFSIIALSFLAWAYLLNFSFSAEAAVAKKFNYQGKLTDTSNIAKADGAYDMVFKIYTVAGGGAAAWTETWTDAALWTETASTTITDGDGGDCPTTTKKIAYTTGTNESSLKAGQLLWNTTIKESSLIDSVSTGSNFLCVYTPTSTWSNGDDLTNRIYVKNGIFSIALGTVTDMSVDFSASDYFLGVTVGADSEMVPRKRITAVGQAINANNLSGDGIINLDNTSTAQDAVNINYNPASGTYSAAEISYGSGGGTGTALKVIQSGTGRILSLLDDTSEIFTVLNGGNVGIGTTAPTNLLDVAGGMKIGLGSYFGTTTAPANGLLIQGNVGIGATNPANKLTMIQTADSNGIRIYGYDDKSASYIDMNVNANGVPVIAGSNGGSSKIYFADGLFVASDKSVGLGGSNEYSIRRIDATDKLVFNADNEANTRMAIDTNGFVGIGTTNPLSMLSVGASSQFQVSSAGIVTAGTWNGSTITVPYGGIGVGTLAANYILKGAGTGPITTSLIYDTGTFVGIGITAPTDKLDIAGGVKIGASYAGIATTAPANGLLVQGNVGIGTTSPDYALQVNGTIAPETDGASDLGSSDKYFKDEYVEKINLKGKTYTVGDVTSGTATQRTLGWTEEAGFNRNDASGYTYLIDDVYVGTIPAQSMKLSMYVGKMDASYKGAFVDFGVDLSSYIGHKLTIKDSANKTIYGTIVSLGTSEQWNNADLILNTAFSSTSNVGSSDVTNTSVTGGQSGNYLRSTLNTGKSSGYASETIGNSGPSVEDGYCIRASAYFKIFTASTQDFRIFASSTEIAALNGINEADWSQKTLYATLPTVVGTYSVRWYTYNAATKYGGVDTASVRYLQTPSATGVYVDSELYADGVQKDFYIYAYKNTPAGKVFSATPAVASMTNDGLLESYAVDLTWDAVEGADGYRITDGLMQNATYVDSATNSVTYYGDTNTFRCTVLPASPYTLGVLPNNSPDLGASDIVDTEGNVLTAQRFNRGFFNYLGAANEYHGANSAIGNHIQSAYIDSLTLYEQTIDVDGVTTLQTAGFSGYQDSLGNAAIAVQGSIVFGNLYSSTDYLIMGLDSFKVAYMDSSVPIFGGASPQFVHNDSNYYANMIYGAVSVASPLISTTTLYASSNVGIGNSAPNALLDIGLAGTTLGVIRLEGSTSGYASLQPTAAAGNVTITLPALTGTVALTANKLSDFAATTSAELASIISNETGTGALVFGTSPTFTTSVLMSDGAYIGQASGPQINFDDTNNYLEISGGNVGIGTTAPAGIFHVGIGATTPFFISTGGLVGIGTTAPTSLIHGVATLSADTGNEVAYQLNYTTNKATSGNDTGLLINQTDTASPGTSFLADFQVGGSSKFNVSNGGNLSVGALMSLSTTSQLTIGRTFSYSSSNGTANAFSGTMSSSGSYAMTFLAITPTYNRSAATSASNTDLLINRTETSLGTTPGTQYLFDAQVGGVSKFAIINSGNVGIGTTAPTNLLDVAGGMKIGLGSYFGSTTAPANGLLIQGNVGIGTTSPTTALDIAAGSIDLDNTTNANQYGIIYKNGTRFIHNFNYGNNGSVTTDGKNIFIGEEAGNFTMGSTATESYESSLNTGVGTYVFRENTTGYDNTGLGYNALSSNTIGAFNDAIGYASLDANTSGNKNTALGSFSLFSNSTGSSNIALGYSAGMYETGSNAFYLNNVDQTNTAGDKNFSLLYGVFSGSAGSLTGQQLTVNGNLGIGTTAPTDKLDVAGGMKIGLRSYFGTTTAPANGLLIQGNVGIGTTSPTGVFQVGIGATTPFFISTGGLVGIGTTNPGSYTFYANGNSYVNGTLTVSGKTSLLDDQFLTLGTDSDSVITHRATSINANTAVAGLIIGTPVVSAIATDTTIFSNITSDADMVFLANDGGNSKELLRLDASEAAVNIGSGTISMAIDASGNLGIGTTSPDRLLHAEVANADTNIVAYIQRLAHVTSGTAAASFGTGMEFELENASGNNKVASTIESIWTTATDSSETSAIVFKNMVSGAAAASVMRIQGASVGIGTTNPGVALHINSTSDTDILRLQDSDGTCNANPESGSVTWSCSSDRRLKKDIVDAGSVLEKLMQLKVREYTVKASGDRMIGVIAQEMQEVMPELVNEGTDGYLSVSEISSWKFLKAIQEQQNQIAEISNSQLQISNQAQISNEQISNLVLKTDQNITSLDELQKSIDEELNKVSDNLLALDAKNKNDVERIANLENLSQTIQAQIDELKKLTNQELNVAQIQAITTDIDYLKTLLGLDRVENPGDISILGKFEAEGIVAGAMTIKVSDEAKRTIGTATIYKVEQDANADGIDDATGSDGQSIKIETTAAKETSKIFVTAKDVTDQPLAVVDVKAGESFTVKVKNPVSQDVAFDWWIVDQQ